MNTENNDLQKKEDAWILLARQSLSARIRSGQTLTDAKKCVEEATLTSEAADRERIRRELLEQKAGVFVSLHKHGALRGCIGTFLPTTGCVASEILQNAVSAALEDPRFEPVSKDELDELEIHVDVLSTPEAIPDSSLLDVKRYGVIVTSGYKRGLLLPDLEGVDTVEEQVSIALRKAGLSEREKHYELERFEVIRHV